MDEPPESNLSTAVVAHREEIENAMTQYFAREIGPNHPTDSRVARHLVNVFIGSLVGPGDVEWAPKPAGVSPSYYTMFGDALIPILRGIVGEGVPHTVLSQFSDSYWRAVRSRKAA